jgi:hypothetical protein
MALAQLYAPTVSVAKAWRVNTNHPFRRGRVCPSHDNGAIRGRGVSARDRPMTRG